MPKNDTKNGLGMLGSKWSATILVLFLLILLLLLPMQSAGQEVASVDSVTVPTSLLLDAQATISDLTMELAYRDSVIAAQKDFYVELLDLKDQRIHILEDAVQDALGSPVKSFLDKLIWGLAGYRMSLWFVIA